MRISFNEEYRSGFLIREKDIIRTGRCLDHVLKAERQRRSDQKLLASSSTASERLAHHLLVGMLFHGSHDFLLPLRQLGKGRVAAEDCVKISLG